MAQKKVLVADIIFKALEKTVDGYVRLEDFMYNPGAYAYGYDRNLKKAAIAQALRRLRMRGFVKQETYNGDLIIRLTDEGKSKLLMEQVLKDEPWDGKWRIVLFDIPEQHQKARRILRARLKLWGFEQWQKSVWASKKNITDLLRQFVKQTGIEKWVLVVESDNIN